MTTRPQKDAHRFFNAMVLMGGSLALGCGGATADGEGTGGSGSQGSGAGGSGSRGSGAGGTGGASQTGAAAAGEFTGLGDTGGAPSMGSGGIPSSGTGGLATGGAPVIATGGAGSVVHPPPVFDVTACQPSQWVCPPPGCDNDDEGVRVPAGCRCDPTLPVDVVCRPGERLACLHGNRDANGAPIREVDFSCRCVPAATSCDACPRIFGGHPRLSCDESRFETGQIICGCAVVFLR